MHRRDATLREITTLIKGVHESARRRDARVHYAFIYPDTRGRMIARRVGIVNTSRVGDDDNVTLHELNFQIGDFLEVTIV